VRRAAGAGLAGGKGTVCGSRARQTRPRGGWVGGWVWR
jgi:hypothetical protein